nr:MAG TPA_asm: coiled-coil domain-containing protein [Caudoviricetes sp.]
MKTIIVAFVLSAILIILSFLFYMIIKTHYKK